MLDHTGETVRIEPMGILKLEKWFVLLQDQLNNVVKNWCDKNHILVNRKIHIDQGLRVTSI